VTLLRQFGVNVRAADPGREVTQAKANNVISTFRGEITRSRRWAGWSRLPVTVATISTTVNGKGGKFKRKANLSPGQQGRVVPA